jgi:hypothetical protein
MDEELLDGLPAESAGLLEVGIVLGQNLAFALIAGRCSAAQAEGLRRLREDKLYKRCTEKWDDFCPRFLKISRAEADRIIHLWEEFGAPYFELTQLTRVSPETFRAIAPAIQGGALHYRGEAIELNPRNSRRVAAAVAELRSALPKRTAEPGSLLHEIQGLCHETNLTVRIEKLHQCAAALVAEFEKISRDAGLGSARMLLDAALKHLRSEIGRVAAS